MMKFYDREQEIAFLRETRETAEEVARFTVVTGRRRIGKTTLIKEAYKNEPFVYFFVARKAESALPLTMEVDYVRVWQKK